MPTATALSTLSKILRDFPLLIPSTSNPPILTLHGYLQTTPTPIPLSLTLPHGPTSLKSSTLSTSHLLHKTLTPSHTPKLRQLLTTSPDAHAFLVELRSMINHAHKQQSEKRDVSAYQLQNAAYYERILNEAEELGWSRIQHISPSLNQLSVVVSTESEANGGDDDRIRCVLDITYPPSYPNDVIDVVSFLPEPFVAKEKESLPMLVVRYEEAMKRWVPFWKVMDDWDGNCLILEPEHPKRSDCWRRVAMNGEIAIEEDEWRDGNGRGRKKRKKKRKCCMSMKVEIDVRNPRRGIPGVRFLGNERVVAVMRDRFNEGVLKWDDEVMPRVNLERILEVKFVRREDKEDGGDGVEVGDGECGICYSWRLEGEVPDVACDKDECARPFHRSCLLEWLKALPDTRQSFHTLFGQCPYCSSAISVKSDMAY